MIRHTYYLSRYTTTIHQKLSPRTPTTIRVDTPQTFKCRKTEERKLIWEKDAEENIWS